MTVKGIFFAKEHPVRKRFQVRENQITLLLETDDKEEALKVWRDSHKKQLDKFHEIYELRNGVYRGTNQFAPGDQVRW